MHTDADRWNWLIKTNQLEILRTNDETLMKKAESLEARTPGTGFNYLLKKGALACWANWPKANQDIVKTIDKAMKAGLSFEVDGHIVYLDNCLDRLPTFAKHSVDAVICDPPYGTTLMKWDSVISFELLWPELKAVTKGRTILFGSQPFTSKLLLSNERQFSHEIIMEKTITGNPFLAKKMPLKKHENILVFGQGPYNPQMEQGAPYARKESAMDKSKNNHKYGAKVKSAVVNDGSRYPGSVQKFRREWSRQQQIHPTQKTIAVMCWIVATYTNKGMTVLDFAAGSGTTGVACAYLGRKSVQIESIKEYFNMCCERLVAAVALYKDAKKRNALNDLELHNQRTM